MNRGFQDIVPWRKSRAILYWRLRRRLLEDRVIKALMVAQPELALGQGEAMLRRWFIEDKGATEVVYIFCRVSFVSEIVRQVLGLPYVAIWRLSFCLKRHNYNISTTHMLVTRISSKIRDLCSEQGIFDGNKLKQNKIK